MGKVFTTDELYAIMRGEQQNQQTAQDARAAMNDRVSERNAQRRAEQLAGVQAKTAGYANGTNPTAAGSVNEGAGEEKPKGTGIDLSPKQNVTGNALYDQWREAMTGRLGKDFEARMNAAEAAADPKKLQDAYRTASDEYDKAKKAESAAWERMKNAPTDAVAEKHRPDYESAKAAREAAEAEFDRSKAQLESAGVELPDTSTWGKIKHLFTGEGQRTTDGFTTEQAAQYKELLSRLDGIQAASAFALTTEQSDALEKERAETLSALHQMDADAGRAERAYDARDRAGAFFKSWGKGTAASYTNTAGNVNEISLTDTQTQRELAELKSQLDRAQAEYDAAVQQYGEAGAQMEKNLLDAAQQRYDGKQAQYAGMEKERAQGDEARQISQHLYDTADKLLTESEQQMAKAKQGTSAAAQFALDAAKTGMDIAADTAASAIGVPGLANMAVRVYGSEAQQARLSGDDAQTAAAKGMKAAMIEVLTEKISGPFEKAYGSSLGKAAAATKVGKAVNAAVDKLKSSGLIRLAMGAAGEGFEEGVSDVLNTVADHVAGWDDGTGTIWDDIKGDKEQILYDMLLGAFVGAFGGAGNLARGNANAAAEAAPIQQTTTEAQSAAPTQQTAPAASAESRAPAQYPQGTQGVQYPQGTREVRTEAPGRTKTTREQREAAKAQAVDDFSNAQVQYYEEHGWEAALPKELEPKNMGKWVKARTAAILEENAARANRGAEATPAAKEQAAAGKTGADYLAEAAGLSKGTEAPQTRTEAQGDNPAPARAQEAKQAGSDELNSALNLNNVETQEEAPTQVQKNTAPTQQKVNIDNTASPVYNDTSKIMGGVSGVAGTGIAADSNGVPGIHQDSNAVHQGRGGLDGVSVGSGLVLLNDKSQATLRERGVAVEAKDASADKAAFSAALADARESDAKHGWAVTPKSAQELAESGAKLITTQNGAAGLAVAKDGDIEAVYSNKAAGAPKGVTKSMIPIAIANGGTKLDCYGAGLVRLYAQYGFVPVAKVKFNPEYANPGWDASKGTPDIYFMMHNGDNADAVVAKEGTYSIPTKAELDALPTMDYDEAYSYRDSLIQEGKRAGSADSAPATVQNVKSENQENAGGVFGPVYNRDAKPYTEEKLSRFWTNTLNETESAAGAPGEVSQPLSYMPKTEKQSLGEAASRLSADRQGEIERLVSAEAWSGVQVDAAASVAADLYREAKTTGNYEAYTAWRKVMQEHITSGGQGVQALAKYSRHSGENALSSIAEAIADSDLTPGQRTTLINKVGDYAQRFDRITRGMPDSDVNAAGNKIRKAPTKELVSLIEDMAHERGTWTFKDNVYSDLLGKQSDAYLKEYAYRQLLAMGNDSLAKASAADKAKAVQSMMQLTSVATFARNIGGNVTFGAVDTMTQDGLGVALDFALSKVTGKRTVGFDKGWLSSEARRGAADAMQKSILEVAGDVDMEGDTNRYGQTSGRAFKMDSSPADRFFSRWQQIMGYSLTTSDKFSRGAIEAEQMRGLGAIKDSGLTNEEMQALATAMADYRLFQNQGTAYGISKAAHDYANAIGFGGEVEQGRRTGGFGLGDFVNTYPGVPANLGVKVLEYSPANVIKGGIEMVDVMIKAKQGKLDVAKQQQAVMDVARGLAGVPAFALFAALTKAGFIRNWDDEDDADVRQQNAAEGKTGIQFNLDGTLRYLNGDKSLEWREGDRLDSIGWLEPINGFMAVGSLMANEPEGSSKWVYVGDIATGAIQSFLDIPVMSNVSDIVDTFQYSKADTVLGKAGEAAAKYAGNMATSFIPSPVRGVAKGIDPYYRDTTGDTAAETAWNQFKLAVPGLRQTLPVKLDNFGQQKMYSGDMAERLLDTLVNPGTRTTIRQSDAARVVEQLYKATGDAGVYPDRKAPNSIKAGDETYTLSAEEKREYQALSGSISSELIASLEANGLYKAADGGKKADIVKDINSYAEEQAKIQWAQSRGQTLDAGETKYEELAEAGVTDIPDYFAAYIGLNGAKSGGKKADYSYVDKVIDEFSKLSQGAQDVLTDKGLNVKKLLYADSKGIDSKDWYTVHEAAKEHEKETGRGSAWVTAEAIGKTVKGDDAEKLKALEAEFPPNDDSDKNEKLHGKRSAVVRRYNAAINAGMSWDDWTTVEKTISDADASWGATSGKYSGERSITKALRDAGYSKSQAAHIWSIYEKTDKETGNFAVYDYFFTDKGEEEAEEKTASGVPRNRDAAADWVMKHSRAAKRRIS